MPGGHRRHLSGPFPGGNHAPIGKGLPRRSSHSRCYPSAAVRLKSREIIKQKEKPWYDGGPGTPALPGEPCRTPPHPSWTKPEKCAWEQLCITGTADFEKYHGKGKEGATYATNQQKEVLRRFVWNGQKRIAAFGRRLCLPSRLGAGGFRAVRPFAPLARFRGLDGPFTGYTIVVKEKYASPISGQRLQAYPNPANIHPHRDGALAAAVG